MKTVLAAIAMTFVLGFLSTAAAFFMVGGQLALRGPYVLAREWPWIYGLMAFLAAAIGFVVGWFTASWPRRRLAIVIVGGWLGEFIVLASGLLSAELWNPLNALGYWVLATAGPAQPIAAYLGAALARRLRRREGEELART